MQLAQSHQITNFLRTIPIFHELDDEILQRLADALELRDFAAGETVVERHQEMAEMLLVLQGELQALLPSRHLDTRHEIARLYPGDYFGVAAMFSNSLNDLQVIGVQSGQLLALGQHQLDRLLESSGAFAKALCRSMAFNYTRGLEKVTSIPFVRLDSFPALARANAILPKRVAKSCRCVVVDRDSYQAKVAMVDPHDERSRSFITNVLHNYFVEFVAITEEDFARHRAELVEDPGDPTMMPPPLDELVFLNASGEPEQVVDSSEQDLLLKVLSIAIQNNASDMHFDPGLPDGRIRLRLDGRMIVLEPAVPAGLLRQLTSRLKVMSQLNITNVRRPQDGRMVLVSGDRRFEMRVAVIPCQGGEKLVLRLSKSQSLLEHLANLFVFESVQRFAEDMLMQPSGLVLVTGPTGSGKTTTLYAALQHLNRVHDNKSFITIEDPVEYNLPFAAQTQVSQELGLGFPQFLRAALRQDVDVILVGEMRDAESAAIAVEAASTGHLVLSTLHTHSAIETIVRLRNLQVKPYMLADALKGIISQKLLRRLAPGYTEVVPPQDATIADLQQIGVLPHDFQGTLVRGRSEPDGPTAGESGRVAAYELLSCTERLRELIEGEAPMSEIKTSLDSSTYLSLQEYCRMLLEDQYVAPERVLEIFPRQAQYQSRG